MMPETSEVYWNPCLDGSEIFGDTDLARYMLWSIGYCICKTNSLHPVSMDLFHEHYLQLSNIIFGVKKLINQTQSV